MRTLGLLLALLPALALGQDAAAPPPPAKAPPAKDQVYKWVDKDGVVHYSSQPPVEGAKPAKLPPLQTFKGGAAPDLKQLQKAGPAGQAAAATGAHLEVVTPSPDETFRSAERVVPVAVMVTPPLADGQKLIYFLDGTPASQPTSNTSFALTGVDRGSHTVSVTLVDAATGDTLATSNGVTIHMKPPIAKPAAPAKPKPKAP